MGKFIPYDENFTIANPEADYKTAEKIDKYRIGTEAFYMPAGFKEQYIPLGIIEHAEARSRIYSANTCTGGAGMNVPVLVLTIGGKKEILQFGKLDKARLAEALLSAGGVDVGGTTE